jgi:hypothetical protein
MRNWVLLDNQLSVTVFCNKDMVNNIRIPEIGESLELRTNGGTIITKLKCDTPDFGEAWFNPEAITNIFSYTEMAKKYQISSDSRHDDAFTVHLPNKKIRFEQTGNGLYVLKPSTLNKQNKEVQLLSSMQENRGFFTTAQFKRAKIARTLYHAMGTQSVQDFKALLRMNMIHNNPVTTSDIELAEKIFGQDIGSLKGKTVRRKPIAVVEDYIEIPKELVAAQHAVKLCIDLINVNGLIFVTIISKHLYYRTAQFTKSKTQEEYRRAIKDVLRIYKKGAFQVSHMYCDNEFRPLQEYLAKVKPDITFNFSNRTNMSLKLRGAIN